MTRSTPYLIILSSKGGSTGLDARYVGPFLPVEPGGGQRMRSFPRGMRRSWWVACAGLVVGLAGGLIALSQSTPVYASSASVLVQPIGNETLNLSTEAQVARSTQTAVEAALHLDGVSAEQIARALTVDAVQGSSVLVMHFEAATPARAAAGANAVAQAYLANRARAARADLDAQTAAIARKLRDLSTQIATVKPRIAALPPDSPQQRSEE